jgi:2-phospho-L-lactate transferase/gluconeogenesis factor (CofD/UPF0052 family)
LQINDLLDVVQSQGVENDHFVNAIEQLRPEGALELLHHQLAELGVVGGKLILASYHVAVARGCDVDQPRNLAKSVTVE